MRRPFREIEATGFEPAFTSLTILFYVAVSVLAKHCKNFDWCVLQFTTLLLAHREGFEPSPQALPTCN